MKSSLNFHLFQGTLPEKYLKRKTGNDYKEEKNFTYLNILDVHFFKYSEKHESLFNHQQSMNHETLHKTLTWPNKAKYDQLQHG